MIPARRLRSIGWVALIGLCAALFMVLAFRVNALKSQVRLAENRIVALKREKLYLETEFETRASQQQLKAWNDVEFGYVAPTAGQYLENERQLAALGKPAGPDAPRPIRVASADDSVAAAVAFPAMVNPLTGKSAIGGPDDAADDDSESKADKPAAPVDHAKAAAALGARLGTVERPARRTSDDAADAPAKPKAKTDAKLATTRAAAPRPAAARDATTPARAAATARPAAAKPKKDSGR